MSVIYYYYTFKHFFSIFLYDNYMFMVIRHADTNKDQSINVENFMNVFKQTNYFNR